MESTRARGYDLTLPKSWTDGVVKGLERDLPPQEQAAPMTIPLLRRLAAAASSEIDFTLILTLLGAIFCAARSDYFRRLRPEDIQDVSADRVQVVLRHLKGEVRLEVLDPVFNRLRPGFFGLRHAYGPHPPVPSRGVPVAAGSNHLRRQAARCAVRQ